MKDEREGFGGVAGRQGPTSHRFSGEVSLCMRGGVDGGREARRSVRGSEALVQHPHTHVCLELLHTANTANQL